MRVVVDFQGESLEFEIPEERVVVAWRGPEGLAPSGVASAIDRALERPLDFPPFRQMFVPGDRVAIALDRGIPQAGLVLEALVRSLARSGVGRDTITVVAPSPLDGAADPGGTAAAAEVHDPDDRARIAYLASTREGRRVYLNRSITDADVVVPVGLLRHDRDLGYGGPWSVLFPDLSDRPTMRSMRGSAGSGTEADRGRREVRLEESAEVSWLLGSQFHLGIVPAASGVLEVVAGRDAAVRARGTAVVDERWTIPAPERAELVVAGVGGPETPSTLEDLAAALEAASGLVRRGGRIAVLSRAGGPIGPALQRLSGVDDPAEAASALRGLEEADDFAIAMRIARAAVWADLFLASGLEDDVAEGLHFTPMDRPDQARRLAANAGSVTFVGRAELTRAELAGD